MSGASGHRQERSQAVHVGAHTNRNGTQWQFIPSRHRLEKQTFINRHESAKVPCDASGSQYFPNGFQSPTRPQSSGSLGSARPSPTLCLSGLEPEKRRYQPYPELIIAASPIAGRLYPRSPRHPEDSPSKKPFTHKIQQAQSTKQAAAIGRVVHGAAAQRLYK